MYHCHLLQGLSNMRAFHYHSDAQEKNWKITGYMCTSTSAASHFFLIKTIIRKKEKILVPTINFEGIFYKFEIKEFLKVQISSFSTCFCNFPDFLCSLIQYWTRIEMHSRKRKMPALGYLRYKKTHTFQ